MDIGSFQKKEFNHSDSVVAGCEVERRAVMTVEIPAVHNVGVIGHNFLDQFQVSSFGSLKKLIFNVCPSTLQVTDTVLESFVIFGATAKTP